MEMTTVIEQDYQFSVKELFSIFDKMQAEKAKSAIMKKDRQKKTLSQKEKLNKLAQLGYVLVYKDIEFTFVDGMGCLTKASGDKVLGATISDLYAEIKANYYA